MPAGVQSALLLLAGLNRLYKKTEISLKGISGGEFPLRIPNVKKETLRGVVLQSVEPGSMVSTDELYSYNLLTSDGYQHGVVSHGKKEYAYYDYRQGNSPCQHCGRLLAAV